MQSQILSPIYILIGGCFIGTYLNFISNRVPYTTNFHSIVFRLAFADSNGPFFLYGFVLAEIKLFLQK